MAINELFYNNRALTQFQRDPDFYQRQVFNRCLTSLVDPERHKARRKLLNPVFSASSIQRSLPILKENIEDIGHIMEQALDSKEIVNIQSLFFYLTVRVALGTSTDRG